MSANKTPNSKDKSSFQIPETDANPDPLADFIGAVSHGALAQNTDRELYKSIYKCEREYPHPSG